VAELCRCAALSGNACASKGNTKMQQDAVAAGIKFFIIFQRLDKREVILRILWPKRHVTNCRTDLWDGFVAWM
jgi:hypothetical protein